MKMLQTFSKKYKQNPFLRNKFSLLYRKIERSRDRGFDSRPGHYQMVTTLGWVTAC